MNTNKYNWFKNKSSYKNTADIQDFFELLKPNVMSLVIFTCFVGLIVAPGEIHPFNAFISILCISTAAGASGCLNMWYEHKLDAIMHRTKNRPIPSGRISPNQAFTFGIILSIGSVTILGLLINWFSAVFLIFTIIYYIVFYTILLKPRTPLNIVVGGAAGAFSPMIGYACVTGNITLESLVLFLIIFTWTPPHFWSLNLYIKSDYEKAKIPMMPNIKGEIYTRKQIIIYSYVMAFCGILPTLIKSAGIIYGIVALIFGIIFIYLAYKVQKNNKGILAIKSAKKLFSFSLLYIIVLFTLLLIEHSFNILFKINFNIFMG